MAASMKDIKNRIKSIENTMQITKAMELVATSKLRHAKKTIESTEPYFNSIKKAMASISANFREKNNVFFGKKEVKNRLFVVIAGDRGLAGGFNQSVFKMAKAEAEKNEGEVYVLPIGKKAGDYFAKEDVTILENSYGITANVHIGDCLDLGKRITKGFLANEFDSVTIFYTKFNSMLSQTAEKEEILPLENVLKDEGKRSLTIYEPSAEAAMEEIVPMYVSGMLYGAVTQSRAAEHAARRTAMNSGNKNAGEMIDELSIKFNRARQAAITQEITEIVAGAQNND